jgi:hypothetical protein
LVAIQSNHCPPQKKSTGKLERWLVLWERLRSIIVARPIRLSFIERICPREESLQVYRLHDLIAAGKSWTLISGMLKRSMKSVKLHAKTLRLVGAKKNNG